MITTTIPKIPNGLIMPTTAFDRVSFLLDPLDCNNQNDLFGFPAVFSQVDLDDIDTAQDIDDFADLIESLSNTTNVKLVVNKSESIEKTNEVALSLDELLPAFSETELDDILGAPKDSDDIDLDESTFVESSSEYDSEVDDMETDEDDDEVKTSPLKLTVQTSANSSKTFSPITPTWSSQAPIDPRCCIKTPIFQKLDSRIPLAYVPRIDARFSPLSIVASPASTVDVPKVNVKPVVKKVERAYVHDAATCWVCKSSKSDERKRILHRYVEKRYQRNWKRGARYSARSRVASSRVREGGRFVTKCQWISSTY